MSNPLEEVRNRARMVLKALKGEGADKDKEQPAAVPEAPADPDRMDPRVEDASPTQEDLDKAKEGDESAEGAEGSEEGADDGAEFEDLGGEGDDDAKDGDDDGFDEFGHKDMDPREVKKSFPKIGHLFPDEAVEELEKNKTAPGSEPKILAELLAAFKGMTDVMSGIKAEIERLKAGEKSGRRELKKALDLASGLQTRLDNIHMTAPAEAPRAVAKSFTQTAGDDQSFTTAELNTLAASQKLGSHEIAMLCMTQQRA